jgi:hypothetical protein
MRTTHAKLQRMKLLVAYVVLPLTGIVLLTCHASLAMSSGGQQGNA